MVSHASLWMHHFLTLSTLWKEMGISEKEGGLAVFNTDILNTFFCQLLKNQHAYTYC